MPERASVSQGVQFGVESVPGTSVAANKLLNSLTVTPGEKVDMQDFRPTGQKYSSIIVPGKEWVEFGIDGMGSYSEIIYALSGILSTPAVSTVDTTAKEWLYSPSSRLADVIKTYTIEQGDSAVRAHKLTYGLFTEIGMEFSRDGVKLDGKGIGQALSDGITLTGSPTAIAQQPMLPTHVDVFLDDASASFGTTKFTRVLNAKLTIGDRFNPIWALNSTLGSFAAHVETVPNVQIELLVEADAQGMGLLTTLRAGATKFIRIQSQSTVLAGAATLPYLFQFSMAGKVADVSEFSDEDGVYAITWTMQAVHDTGWGQAMSVVVRNQQAAL